MPLPLRFQCGTTIAAVKFREPRDGIPSGGPFCFGESVEIEYAILARGADLGADGTLSALGMGFDRIRTSAVPRAFPVVVITRLNETQEVDKLLVELDVTGPGGSILDAPFVNEMPLKRVAPGVGVTPPNTASILIGMPGLMFPVYGKYDFKITVTGANVVTRTISVMVEQVDA